MLPPEVVLEEHWQKFLLPLYIGSGRGFSPDEKGRQAMRMAFFKAEYPDQEHWRLEGKVWFGHGIEGPPGHVHGGVSSFVLDEIMGATCWLNHLPCVAKTIEIDFKEMTPIGVDHDVVGEITKIDGREVYVLARIYDKQKDHNFVISRGVFYALSREVIDRLGKADKCGYDFSQLRYLE